MTRFLTFILLTITFNSFAEMELWSPDGKRIREGDKVIYFSTWMPHVELRDVVVIEYDGILALDYSRHDRHRRSMEVGIGNQGSGTAIRINKHFPIKKYIKSKLSNSLTIDDVKIVVSKIHNILMRYNGKDRKMNNLKIGDQVKVDFHASDKHKINLVEEKLAPLHTGLSVWRVFDFDGKGMLKIGKQDIFGNLSFKWVPGFAVELYLNSEEKKIKDELEKMAQLPPRNIEPSDAASAPLQFEIDTQVDDSRRSFKIKGRLANKDYSANNNNVFDQ